MSITMTGGMTFSGAFTVTAPPPSYKAIFGYGNGPVSMTNKVSNTGVVATDTTGVGTARSGVTAAGYGSDKAIFGYGYASALTAITNLV